MLVAMAVTLILIFALSQAFALVGDTVAKGRAAIEMSGNLRAVANRLQADLDGITVAVRPWADDASGVGYFETGEGPLSAAPQPYPSLDKDWDGDLTYNTDPTATDTTRGDIDDYIAFTTRNSRTPYLGRLGTTTIRSADAEVVWWIQYEDLDGNGIFDAGEKLLIYRRVLLIRPDQGVVLNRAGPAGPNNPGAFPTDQTGLGQLRTALQNFYNNYDLSVRLRWWVDGNGVNVRLIANSLADLTRRENRFAHLPILSDRSPSLPANQQLSLAFPPVAADPPYDVLRQPPANPATGVVPGFPFVMDVNRRSVTSLYRLPKLGANLGEDVMVSDALCFDVKVFDPEAPMRPGNTGEAMVPSDPGFFVNWTANAGNQNRPTDAIGLGAFVDLGYGAQYYHESNNALAVGWSVFSGNPQVRSGLWSGNSSNPARRYAYCTWSTHYERNGIDEDNDGQTDEGTNGLDEVPYSNGIDDVGERETSPPYPNPLRGLQVKIRAIDIDSRQIRQVTVVSDFIPE
jgi:hypothetical protein